MAGKQKHSYPSDKKLQELLEKLGTMTKVADKLEIPRSTLQSYCRERGIELTKPETRKVDELIVSEEEMLEQRLKELESSHRQVRKQNVFEERVLKVLDESVKSLEPKYSPRAIRKKVSPDNEHEFALLWSDTHAGETVSQEETNGINGYDWNVMLKRHDKLRESLFSYLDNRPFPVSRLHVWALGDMLSGNIHDELSETNEIPLAEATVQAGLDFSVWMESLLERFNEIQFSGVVGNHPRAHQKPRAKQSFDNADWVMYHTMKLALRKYPQIKFDIPKAAAHPVMVAKNWRAMLWHGDGVRSSMPGVPWGGVMRRVAALQNQYTTAGMPIDIFCNGHFHTANVVEGSAGRVAMNGSVKGVDEYSLKAFGSGAPARQVLLCFHPRHGLTDVSFIDLQDVKPAGGW